MFGEFDINTSISGGIKRKLHELIGNLFVILIIKCLLILLVIW